MARPLLDRYKRGDDEFDRAIAFIDATFAVALTLLVTTLDYGTDPGSWDSLGSFYDAAGSQFLIFGISFLVIAGYWLAHYRLIATFKAIDLRFIVINLVLLAAIVILPFTTESAGDPAIDDLPLPTIVLALNVAAVSTAFTLIYVAARRRGLLRDEPAPTTYRWTVTNLLAPTVVFAASIPIAVWASAGWARLSWLLLVPVSAVIGTVSKRSGVDL